MSKSELSCNTIYQVLLSSDNTCYKKYLTLIEVAKDEGDPFVMVNIRRYSKEHPTKSGISLTQYEYDWILNLLTQNIEKDKNFELINKTSIRKIIINVKPNESLEIVQCVDGINKRITLTSTEKKKLIEKYGNFYDIIDEMEANA